METALFSALSVWTIPKLLPVEASALSVERRADLHHGGLVAPPWFMKVDCYV
jgi:hypothetical protein